MTPLPGCICEGSTRCVPPPVSAGATDYSAILRSSNRRRVPWATIRLSLASVSVTHTTEVASPLVVESVRFSTNCRLPGYRLLRARSENEIGLTCNGTSLCANLCAGFTSCGGGRLNVGNNIKKYLRYMHAGVFSDHPVAVLPRRYSFSMFPLSYVDLAESSAHSEPSVRVRPSLTRGDEPSLRQSGRQIDVCARGFQRGDARFDGECRANRKILGSSWSGGARRAGLVGVCANRTTRGSRIFRDFRQEAEFFRVRL